MTLVAVPIAAADPAHLAALAVQAKAEGADLVEVRLDTCASQGADPLACARAIAGLALPAIATARHPSERGTWAADEAQRGRVLAAAAQAGARYVDVELAHWNGLRPLVGPLPAGTGLILSYHDFAGPGDDLPGRIRAMRAAGAAVAKVAIMARDAADLAIIHDLYQAGGGPLVALAMGEHGMPSRQLAGVFGAPFTFARLEGDGGSAPGQPTVRELIDVFRLRAQRPGMPVYGVIGSPIAHSLSPHLHNTAFAAEGVDGIYARFRVEDVPAFWRACGAWIQGLSITIPHKSALMPLMDDLEPLARAVGVMNTVYRVGGRLVGANTDATAIAAGLGELEDRHVLVLGAGGVARAAAFACAMGGAHVTIVNRTQARAQELVDDLNRKRPLMNRCPGHEFRVGDIDSTSWYDVLVNGTSIGMGKPDETPWQHPHRPGSTVFDTVYTPLDTRLLREARAAGCVVVDGASMFVRQAAEQFTLWTSRPAPRALMRRTILDHLAAR